MTNPIPKGYQTITVSLTVKDAAKAIEFYKEAFGAEEIIPRCYGPDGKTVMHAEMKFGSSIFMINDEFKDMACLSPTSLNGTPVSMYVYVDNVDAVHAQAVKSGAKATMPLTDMFWGDRFGQVVDPFGHRWGLAQHVKDMTEEEMKKAQEIWTKEMACANK